MSGFDTGWLDLREPADRAARHGALRRHVATHLETPGAGAALVVDLGCGTGSTFRALLPDAAAWRWRLVDNDPRLLEEAQARHGGQAATEFVETDLAALEAGLFSGAHLVTASALFDLVSEDVVVQLARHLGAARTGLYAALNYDGACLWDSPHDADMRVVAAFNAHQKGDKGFGPALGPASGPSLKRIFEAEGFDVRMAASPWRLGPAQAPLQRQFIEGMAEAAGQMHCIDPLALEDWRQYRLSATESSACEVGHWDVLALP